MELEASIRTSAQRPQLTPTVIEEIIRNQYSSFMAIASKVAAIHDQTTKAKDHFMKYQEKYLGISSRESIQVNKDSFSQMASYLVPSLSQSQQPTQNQQQFGQKSVFGASTMNSNPTHPLSLGTSATQQVSNNAFSNSFSASAPKRSNSLSAENTKRPFGK